MLGVTCSRQQLLHRCGITKLGQRRGAFGPNVAIGVREGRHEVVHRPRILDPAEDVGGLSRRGSRPQLRDHRPSARGGKQNEQLRRTIDDYSPLIPQCLHKTCDQLVCHAGRFILQRGKDQSRLVIGKQLFVLAVHQCLGQHRSARPVTQVGDGLQGKFAGPTLAG